MPTRVTSKDDNDPNYSRNNNIKKEFKQDSALGPLGISNLLLKEISKYTLDILARVGNYILFNEVPLLDKWFMLRKVLLIEKAHRDPLNSASYRGISLLNKYGSGHIKLRL